MRCHKGAALRCMEQAILIASSARQGPVEKADREVRPPGDVRAPTSHDHITTYDDCGRAAPTYDECDEVRNSERGDETSASPWL